jgi:hypothetical protein
MAETLATYSVPEHHVAQFTGNVRALLTKKGGILTPYVSRGSYRGEKIQLINFIGPVEFIERRTVYADTKVTELEHTSRWITGREYDCAVLVDRLDTLKMIYDPTNPYTERMREAAARRMDQIVMDAFYATAKAGKDGSTSVAFPAGNIVAHASAGLTVAKLRSLRKMMKKKHVDLRGVRPLIAVTAEEIDDLLGETSVNSIDYNSVKPLVDGEVTSFMGFNFLPYEDNGADKIYTYDDTGTVRRLPVWTPDGMHLGVWDALTIIINNRADKNNIKQIHATFTAGATRVDEDNVFAVDAKE